jgi:hypothetical protein
MYERIQRVDVPGHPPLKALDEAGVDLLILIPEGLYEVVEALKAACDWRCTQIAKSAASVQESCWYATINQAVLPAAGCGVTVGM